MVRIRTRKRPGVKKTVHKLRKRTTRVTVDFPKEQHRHLKARAALEGVTLQQYIRSHIMEKVESSDIPDAKFKKVMKKIMEEDEDILRRLADK